MTIGSHNDDSTQVSLAQLPLPIALGGSGADLSGSGGASFVVKQLTAGGAFTSALLTAADLSGLTPALGAITVTSVNKVAITAPATGSTLTIADGKTLTVNHTLTLTGTSGTTHTFPSTSATLARTDAGQTFTGTQAFGALTATTVNAVAITAPAAAATLTIANNKTLTVSNSLTLAGTDSTVMTFPSVSASLAPLTSPSFTTPTLGVATATSINKVTVTTPATGSTLTIADGKTFTVSNSVTLAGKEVTWGAWQTRAYAAGNYTGSGSLTWTVDSGDITTEQWCVVGNMLFFIGAYQTTSTGGTASGQLKILIPGSYTANKFAQFSCHAVDAGTDIPATVAQVSAGGTQIMVLRDSAVSLNWSNGAVNNTSVFVAMFFEIQ